MLAILRIWEPNEIYMLCKRYGWNISLTEERNDIARKCVLKFLQGETVVGMADSSLPSDSKGLLLHFLFLENCCRNKEHIRQVLARLVQEAGEDFGKAVLCIRHDLKNYNNITVNGKETKNPWDLLLSGWEGYSWQTQIMWQNTVVNLKELSHNHTVCFSKKLGKTGTEVVSYQDAEPQILEQASALEKTRDKQLLQLLPFDGSSFDPRHSMFLIDTDTKDIMGWIMVRHISSGCAEIARYYIKPEYRSRMSGMYLGCRVINSLSQEYEKAYFKVLWDNEKMRKFITKAFRDESEHSLRINGYLSIAEQPRHSADSHCL